MKIFLKQIPVRRFLSLVMVALVLATSCTEDFFDVPPQGQQPNEEFWVSAEDAAKAVNAMYANLRGWPQVAFAAIAVSTARRIGAAISG